MNIEVKNSRKPVQYEKSMAILEQRVKDVILGTKNELLWILEHKNVYTAGSSSVSEDLIDKKINVLKTNRGGKHTFHGPGQKVIYFVLDLNKRGKNIRKLVNDIENLWEVNNYLQDNRIDIVKKLDDIKKIDVYVILTEWEEFNLINSKESIVIFDGRNINQNKNKFSIGK